MFRQMCRKTRLNALLQDNASDEPLIQQLSSILHPQEIEPVQQQLTGIEVANMLRDSPLLSRNAYDLLLAHMQVADPQCCSAYDLNHAWNALVLPTRVRQLPQFHFDGRIFSTHRSHLGNGGIQFYRELVGEETETGFIESIWQFPFKGNLETAILVRLHRPLPLLEEYKAPYSTRERLQTQIIDAAPSDRVQIIKPSQIITNLATYKRPRGTFGIGRDALIICWALGRGRRNR